MFRQPYHPNALLSLKRNIQPGLSARTKILSALEKNTSTTRKLCQETKLNYSSVLYHLHLLEAENILSHRGKRFYFSRIAISNGEGESTNTFKYNDTLILNIELNGRPLGERYNIIFHVYNELGQRVCAGHSAEARGKYFNAAVKKIRIELGPLVLTSGKYTIELIARTGRTGGDTADTWESAIGFTVIECQPFETNWEVTISRCGSCVINHSFSEAE